LQQIAAFAQQALGHVWVGVAHGLAVSLNGAGWGLVSDVLAKAASQNEA